MAHTLCRSRRHPVQTRDVCIYIYIYSDLAAALAHRLEPSWQMEPSYSAHQCIGTCMTKSHNVCAYAQPSVAATAVSHPHPRPRRHRPQCDVRRQTRIVRPHVRQQPCARLQHLDAYGAVGDPPDAIDRTHDDRRLAQDRAHGGEERAPSL